ncbi:MAG: S49 family peptidase [Ruminococcaceae bacterium]|nr:S49 family peptidase [Oscillospiraceae bacterium]
MPSWSEVLQEIQGTVVQNPLDSVRKKYLQTLTKYTGRNVISYYSGFLQKPGNAGAGIDDNDKNAFMQAVYKLDKSKGLDLLLHTPGGDIAATQSIVDYLKQIFGNNIRAIIPQIAMSAGTMIALSCKEIIMGKQSNIGPIDPQFGGMSCAGIIEEFENAVKDAQTNPASIPIWQTIISKYHPSFLGDCHKAIKWSNDIVQDWLMNNMFNGEQNKTDVVSRIVNELSDHTNTKNHARHISRTECENLGIKIVSLEGLDNRKIDECLDLQDCILTIHHSYMHTFSNSHAIKIVESNLGNTMVMNI